MFALIVKNNDENIIEDSTIVLHPQRSFDKSYEELQKLKKIGIADSSALIKHPTGPLIPAGIYDSYEDLMDILDYLYNFESKNEENILVAVTKIVISIARTPEGDKNYFSAFECWKNALEEWHDIEIDRKMEKTGLKTFLNIYNSSSIKKKGRTK